MDFLFLMICCGMASLPDALKKLKDGTATASLVELSPNPFSTPEKLVRRKSKREFFHKPEYNIQTYSRDLSTDLQPDISPSDILQLKSQATILKQDPPVWDALNHLKPQSSGTSQDVLRTAVPGVDYPTLAEIPESRFSCEAMGQPGFYADAETGCQVFRRCDFRGVQWSYLCPNATLFNQITLVCDWFFNVDCSKTKEFYHYSNSRLYHPTWPLLDNQNTIAPNRSDHTSNGTADERLIRRKNGHATSTTQRPHTTTATTTMTSVAVTMTWTSTSVATNATRELLRRKVTSNPVRRNATSNPVRRNATSTPVRRNVTSTTASTVPEWKRRPFRLVWGGSYVS